MRWMLMSIWLTKVQWEKDKLKERKFKRTINKQAGKQMRCDTLAWYGMAWYGMVWFGMVWHAMARVIINMELVDRGAVRRTRWRHERCTPDYCCCCRALLRSAFSVPHTLVLSLLAVVRLMNGMNIATQSSHSSVDSITLNQVDAIFHFTLFLLQHNSTWSS